jgi:hypothetical protein
MFKRAKILALPLILAAILMVLSFPGCGGNGAGELTAQELQQVMSDSLLAVKNAASYGFSLDMDINAEATGGSQAGKMEISMRADGVTDMPDEEMQMNLEMSMDQDIPGEEGGSQEVSLVMYLLDDWIYMKMKMTGMDEQWVKTPATEDVKETFNMDIVSQQLAPLESMVEIEFVKYESVDSSQCYVLKIVPDVESMKDWLDQQQMTTETFDWSQMGNLEDIFKELSYTLWIAKDTNLMKKMKMAMSIEMSAEQAGASGSDFDTMSMDIGLEMTMQDYNEPVSIILPDEAENATEM